MAGFYLAQGGTTLSIITPAGAVTNLTLPTGITLDANRRLRGAVLGNQVVLVNSPSENLMIDREGTVRILVPRPPSTAFTLGTASGGTLSGTFNGKFTYIVKDLAGNLISESEFSPVSGNASPSTQHLAVTLLETSNQTVSGRRLYRTATGPGAAYFQWLDIEGNTQTAVNDDLADAGLSTIAAPTDLGNPPKFTHIVAWGGRLWGRTDEAIDTLHASGIGKAYGWPSSLRYPIPPTNKDQTGITGFIPRRDFLGVGRRDSLHKITTSSATSYNRVTEADGVGLWAADSVAVAHDVGYFLGNPFGVYRWGSQIENISTPKVKAWFDTDTYFNRARFDQAVGCYDPLRNVYILNLSAAGSTDLDRWIEYDIASDTWWGPHITSEFTPTGCVTIRDANDVAVPAFLASDGKLYKPQATKTDGSATGVALDVYTNFLSANSPDIHKTWLDPTIVSKIQASGTLTVTPYIGGLDASAGTAISHTMTLGREVLRRLGSGRFCQLRLQNSTAGVDVVVYGLELPFFELGRR